LKKTIIMTSALLCHLLPHQAHSDELSNAPPLATYAGLESLYNRISDHSHEYNPLSAKLRAGIFLQTNIALELQVGANIHSDNMDNSREISLTEQTGLFLRFQSPIEQGIRVYLYGGYNELTLTQTAGYSSMKFDSGLESSAWGMGFEEQISQLKNVIFYLDYSRPYDDEIRISQYSLGARYQF
jgi:hypothetical protein